MVVIIGTTHHNTLSMVRSFGLAGEKVDVILHDGRRDSYVLKSKYIEKAFVEQNERDAYECLLRNYPSATIIASSDAIASLMDRNLETIKERFKFFNCGEQGLLTKYMDKEYQTKIAQSAGIETPKTKMYEVGGDFPKDVEYPCILKPLESINGGKKIKVCHNDNELTAAVSAFENGIKILIQQFINKDYEIVLAGVRVNGRTVIPGYVHKHRDRLGGTTYSTVYPISKLPVSVTESCHKLVDAMNYEGLFGIELMVKDGRFYFVEINLRNDATTYAMAIAGCNVPLIYSQVVNDHNVVPDIQPIREIDSMVEFPDILFAIKGRVPFLKWLKQRNSCECLYFKSKEDITPYYSARNGFVKDLAKRICHL